MEKDDLSVYCIIIPLLLRAMRFFRFLILSCVLHYFPIIAFNSCCVFSLHLCIYFSLPSFQGLCHVLSPSMYIVHLCILVGTYISVF